MVDLLHGRQRRYFGYNRDVQNKIDTPDSAKSYRSIISPLVRTAKRHYEPVKTFRPDPPGPTRFADIIIQKAVKTQIPGLIPALKNSPQFPELENNPIYLRSPDFEQHFERSLYNFWLQKDDRRELCGIFDRHLKARERERLEAAKRVKKGKGGTDRETAMEQQRFLESIARDPRLNNRAKRRESEVPNSLLRMNRKFQMSYWDPTFNKHLTDPYGRKKNKVPAFDSICHEHFGIPDRDLTTCLAEYKKRYALKEELNADHIELSDWRERLRRITLFGSLEEEEKRRGFKHIKPLKEYDEESTALWKKQAKLMVSAAEYINKIKMGRRFPTPPREILRKRKRRGSGGSVRSSKKLSSDDIREYMGLESRQKRATSLRGLQKSKRDSTSPHSSQEDDNKSSKSRKSEAFPKATQLHDDYNSEEFYMEMYLHFLNPEEDVSLKTPPKVLTDVKELRKKMNLDENHEEEKKLIDLLNSDSVEALHIHPATRKTILTHHQLTPAEFQHEKEILEHHLDRLKNPRLKHMLTRMVSQMSLQSSNITMTDSSEGEEDREEVTPPPDDKKKVVEEADDDLDKIGDIPDYELQLIMKEIADSSESSSDQLSSGSSGEGEEEGEGDQEDNELTLFKKQRKKKDSVAELMDLTADFREAICKPEEGKPPEELNPFAEAVCILYPQGSEKKKKKRRFYDDGYEKDDEKVAEDETERKSAAYSDQDDFGDVDGGESPEGVASEGSMG